MFTRIEALARVAMECELEALDLPLFRAVSLPRTHHAEQLMVESERALNAERYGEMVSLIIRAWDEFNRNFKQAQRARLFCEEMLKDCSSPNWKVNSVHRQEAVVLNEQNLTKANQCVARINAYVSELQHYFIETDMMNRQCGFETSSDWERVVCEAREWREC